MNYLPSIMPPRTTNTSAYTPIPLGAYGVGSGFDAGPITGRAPSIAAPTGFGLDDLAMGGNALQGIFNSWMAMKQYGLGKQQLAEGKRQFGLNFEAQRNTVNSQLEDRQRARVASNPGAYQSVGAYMDKNGIKGG